MMKSSVTGKQPGQIDISVY